MRTIGFSTGALAREDFRKALEMLTDKPVNAVELSALRQHELAPLVQQLDDIDLERFEYVAFHAPSSMDRAYEPEALRLLEVVAARGWPIVVHPDAMHTLNDWNRLGSLLCIENMDKRKPAGRTAEEIKEIFDELPEACFCFDIGHARQVDPTMSEATAILRLFHAKLRQLHVSEVNTQSKHDPLTLESLLAFHKVSHLVPTEVPIILESRVPEENINDELERALEALNVDSALALAGD
jgi:hypothetical protein